MTDPETHNPLKGEAQAQDEETIMPWFWGAIGLLVLVGVVASLIFGEGHRLREPPGAAPAVKPISQHY